MPRHTVFPPPEAAIAANTVGQVCQVILFPTVLVHRCNGVRWSTLDIFNKAALLDSDTNEEKGVPTSMIIGVHPFLSSPSEGMGRESSGIWASTGLSAMNFKTLLSLFGPVFAVNTHLTLHNPIVAPWSDMVLSMVP